MFVVSGCAVTLRVVVEVTPPVVFVGVVVLPGLLLRLVGDGIRDEYRTYSFMVDSGGRCFRHGKIEGVLMLFRQK